MKKNNFIFPGLFAITFVVAYFLIFGNFNQKKEYSTLLDSNKVYADIPSGTADNGSGGNDVGSGSGGTGTGEGQ